MTAADHQHFGRASSKRELAQHLIDRHGLIYPAKSVLMKWRREEMDTEHRIMHEEEVARERR